MLYRKNITRPESLLRVVGGHCPDRSRAVVAGRIAPGPGAGSLGRGQHPERGVRLLPRLRHGGPQASRVSGAP